MTATDEVTEGRRPADTFGARLALMRQSLGGWNIKRTAEYCEIGDQAWRNWEAGKNVPRDYLAVCHHIATTLGFDFKWLALGGPLDPASTRWYSSAAAA